MALDDVAETGRDLLDLLNRAHGLSDLIDAPRLYAQFAARSLALPFSGQEYDTRAALETQLQVIDAVNALFFRLRREHVHLLPLSWGLTSGELLDSLPGALQYSVFRRATDILTSREVARLLAATPTADIRRAFGDFAVVASLLTSLLDSWIHDPQLLMDVPLPALRGLAECLPIVSDPEYWAAPMGRAQTLLEPFLWAARGVSRQLTECTTTSSEAPAAVILHVNLGLAIELACLFVHLGLLLNKAEDSLPLARGHVANVRRFLVTGDPAARVALPASPVSLEGNTLLGLVRQTRDKHAFRVWVSEPGSTHAVYYFPQLDLAVDVSGLPRTLQALGADLGVFGLGPGWDVARSCPLECLWTETADLNSLDNWLESIQSWLASDIIDEYGFLKHVVRGEREAEIESLCNLVRQLSPELAVAGAYIGAAILEEQLKHLGTLGVGIDAAVECGVVAAILRIVETAIHKTSDKS